MKALRSVPVKPPRAWLSQSRWMVAFFLFCGAIYLHGLRQKDRSYHDSVAQLQILEQEKQAALERQQELLLETQSQSDPAWVEMVLKRNLGLVPEGQVKVYFHQD